MSDLAVPSPSGVAADEVRVALNRLLIAGLLLRVLVFFFASPFNSDQHLEVIRYIAEHHALPASNVLQQSFHPPLYYLLMTPIALVTTATWPIHLFSLLVSCANLWLIRRLMDDSAIVAVAPRPSIRIAGFAMVALLAQLIMFGSFISNDPLTQLIGTVQFIAILAFLRRPEMRGVILLAVLVAVGLLTKGTFLLTALPVAAIILRTTSSRHGRRTAMKFLGVFVGIALVFGSYKYVDNAVRLGRPLVHNQEMHFSQPYSRAMWHGWLTFYGFDLPALIRRPVVLPSAPGSYTRMLYATFWYAYLADSSFRGNFSGYEDVGRLTYLLALVPTILFLIGVGIAIKRLPRLRRREEPSLQNAMLAASLGLLCANLAVVVAAGLKFDLWECFQARLCFQSAAPILILFFAGANAALDGNRAVRSLALACCWGVVACFVLYFCVEFALAEHVLAVDESKVFEIYR